MAARKVKEVLKRSEIAWRAKNQWRDLLQECYEFGLPQRNPYYADLDGTGRSQTSQGQKKTDRLFDSTLAVDVIKIANRIQTELMPAQQVWADLKPGVFVDESDKELSQRATEDLQRTSKTVFAAIHLSNFDTSIGEYLLDLIVAGTACMLVHEGDDDMPVHYQAVPQSQVALEEGPFGSIWGIYRRRRMVISLIESEWDDAKLPEKVEKRGNDDPEAKADVLEATYFDKKDGVWRYEIILTDQGKSSTDSIENRIVEREYALSRWVVTRWLKGPGEVQGRSLVMMALPDAKTLNKVKELLLRNAALGVAGVWMVRNDGVINSNTIRIVPGATIPVKSTGGPAGASVSRLDVGGDLQMSQLIVQDLVTSIHAVMMNEGLPNVEDAVRSATEVIARLRQLQTDLGSPFGRILKEGVVPLLQNTLHVLGLKGILQSEDGAEIKLDGGQVKVEFVSPIAQAQNIREIENVLQWLQILKGLGEEVFMLNAKVEDAGQWLGKKMNVPAELIRPEGERRNMEGQAGQLLALQAQGGAAPPAVGGAGATVPVAGGQPGAGAQPQPIAA